ncbi:putative nucleotidyltransferase substrate binding domain-containing protein [Deferribacter abyssi]|uniref:putative nucleotidyltransferase substrate binding domain-containing protein n=1 Tax=Deferribacter abyssi TaxID=213806 RepID=UPI003C2A6B97
MGILKRLKQSEPFKNLPDHEIEKFREKVFVKKFSNNEVIFSQYDEPTGFLYFIIDGIVEIFTEATEGVEVVVDIRKEGEFFGWTPIFSNEGYTAGAKTATITECLLIPRELILDISRKYPIIANFFSKAVFSRIKRLYSDVVKTQLSEPVSLIEAFPFQKKLIEIMSSPVEICFPETTVHEIAKIMTIKGIGSILVCDHNRKLIGIITERDLVVKVLAREIDSNLGTLQAKDIMTPEPYYMSPETYMYEAAAFMLRHKIRHLPVLDGDKIVGIVTIRDLMKFRSQKTIFLVGKAKEARSLDELSRIKKELVLVAKVLLMENRSHVETMEIISYIHHNIIKRCFKLVYEDMISDGFKPPDIKFCFMIMGSGGRKEMLLGPDQDNGFVFEDYPDELHDEVEAFFVPFAERLVNALARVGYSLCHGKVMVNNPLWRGRLKDWKERIAKWIEVPEPQRVRYSSIFFDFMPLIGETRLCHELRDFVYKEIKENSIFLYHMMELDFKHKVPLGILGRFITSSDDKHKGKLSVKENGSIFIVDCVRMYMLEKGIYATTTIDRLDKLLELKVFNAAMVEHIKAAFEFFTYIRLKNEINLIEQGKEPSHYLDPYKLPKQEQELLKEAFKVADKLQESTRRYFSRIVGR